MTWNSDVFKHRGCTESSYYRENVDGICGSARESDERVTFIITWTLVRETDWSHYPVVAQTPKGPLRVYKTIEYHKTPAVVVYFTVSEDDQMVHLEDIRVVGNER